MRVMIRSALPWYQSASVSRGVVVDHGFRVQVLISTGERGGWEDIEH